MAGARAKKRHRAAFAYEARNLQREVILQRVSSCTENMGDLIILDTMVEAAVKARSFGFKFLLFLTDSLRPV